jgi:hypothetical protein
MKPTSANRIIIPYLIRNLESFWVARKARPIFIARTSLLLIFLCILNAASTVDGRFYFFPAPSENRQISSPLRLLSKDLAAVIPQERLEAGALAQTSLSREAVPFPADEISRHASLNSGLAGFIPDSDNFKQFIQVVSDGQAGVPRGVYAQDTLALPIIQQPANNPLYVSNKLGLATQYSRAAQYGVTGILAHNYLSGESFDRLTLGQTVVIVYGDRATRLYQVREIHRFQKIDRADHESDYLDLASGNLLNTAQVFTQFYRGGEHVTFQTCLKGEGIWNWGLVFVVAEPIKWPR